MGSKNAGSTSRDGASTIPPEARAAPAEEPKLQENQPAAPAPDAMLGVWSSWMNAASGSAQRWSANWGDPGTQWWQVTPDAAAGQFFASGVKQLNDSLMKDPVLRSIDQMWNANPLRDVVPVNWAEIARALRTVWLRSLRDPVKTLSSATELGANFLTAATQAWNEAGRLWWESARTGVVAAGGSAPASADKRFAASEWHANPAYRTLKEMYLLASDWLLRQGNAEDISDADRQHLNFHLRQFVDAMSPSLQLLSNPEALRRAMETGGASVAAGARNLLQDLKEGRLSMVDATAFAPGRNLALTPGKVVHRNKLIELIQYAPATDTVHQTPLLILPPWINKYYILDMQPKNSMVGYLVAQGFTVFVVSWKNPDSAMDGTTIEDYMDFGPLEASEVIREITGSPTVNVMGYCIGGTLLAMTLAWLATKGDRRFASATFMVSLQDFSKVGDTAVFLGEPAIDFVEQQMLERGYLDSREMSNMFNLLRSNDLIWSNVVNNYLLGQKPPAFDLLYWNSDGTRMTRAAHSWYLRNTYGENNLIQPNKIELKGEALDLSRITLDVYAVGAEKDHIVPWEGAWRVTQLTGGKVHFVLASSGHIAGIINPPGGKGAYWINDAKEKTSEEWRQSSARHDGSWWTDWTRWLSAHGGRKGKPPAMGSAAHPALDDAPGRYVLEK
jgi:polyhydroxyalkanoate synthase subunit PhaC